MAPCITISLIFQDLGLPHFRLVKHNVTEDEMELGRQVSIATSLSHLMNIMYHFIDHSGLCIERCWTTEKEAVLDRT